LKSQNADITKSDLCCAGEQGNLLSCFILEFCMGVIETERLVLRPLTPEDAAEIAAKIDDYQISKNLARVPFPYHLSDAEEFLDWALALDHRSAFRAITLKSDPQQIVGIISYDWMQDAQKAELGYWLVPEVWGKGMMTEAAKAMVELAFTHSDLDSLSSCYFNENPASGKVLSRAGFVVTGACSQFSRARGGDVPVTTVRLARADWLNKKAAV
jgi:RimJ/RimL family protein N-acetyltransferase